MVSAVIVAASQPEEVNEDSGSVTVQVTLTSLTYQPALPSVPTMWGVITGGVTSLNVFQASVKAAPSTLLSHHSPLAPQAPIGAASESWIAAATRSSTAIVSVAVAPFGTTPKPNRSGLAERSAYA